MFALCHVQLQCKHVRLAAGDGVVMAGIPNEPPIHRPDVVGLFRKHYRPCVCTRRHFEHVRSRCDVRFLCLQGAQAESILIRSPFAN